MVRGYAISRGVSPRESFEQVGELAREVEDRGFEALWFIDHQLGMKDVYTAMNVAAMATSRIHIGSAVTNLKTRHPTVTANATTALDDLSGGRAMLGLGAGWVAVHSIGQSPSRLAEVRQGIADFRALFSGQECELYGTRVRLATAMRQVPVYLAVSQPGMLRLCGETCDGAVLMGAADPDFCRWQLDFLYEGLERAGRRREDVLVDLTVTLSIDDDEDQALADVRAWATSQAATFSVWKHMPETFERFRPEFTRAKEAYHYEEHLSLRAEHKQVVSDEFVQRVAVAGNLAACVARLREIVALDIDRVTFALLSGGRRRRLDQLADELIPALQSASGEAAR
jgi:5,10-methylenetetrahydromethanopterin reductase